MESLFEVPKRASRADDNRIAKMSNTTSRKSTVTVKGGGGLMERINTARALVSKNLGQFADEYIVISEEGELENYISKAIDNDIIAIDTETTGLDPILDSIAGACIYTPDMKPAYVPINHISYITNELVDGQVSVECVREQFQRLADADTKIIMFSADFDIRVIRNQVGVRLKCYWDCYLAARLLNENEPKNNLKALHNKYVLDGKADAFKFEDLFKGIPFTMVPVNVGYLYAAHDAIITYELYEFQKPYLTPEDDMCVEKGLVDVAKVFREIEMPCVEVVADMEDTGVEFDLNYADELHEKYHSMLDNALEKIYILIDDYKVAINEYKSTHPNAKLDEKININSSVQVAILLYDIMQVPVVDPEHPRGTGEKILAQIDNPICKAILEYRSLSTLIGTFIDKLPECVNPNDGRIHCKFNQYGADTGRMSSSDPNLQNIPSHNKDIRKLFTATKGYVLMSSDYSQQEPKTLAAMCKQDGDSQMYNVFMEGKDLYSEIASKAFNVPYEDCKEFNADGTTNKEGKARRTQAKSILLGINYGRGVASIAEQLGCSVNKAQDIKNSVFKGFPAIKQFEANSIQMAKDYGYVTTVCGRKRRLPSMMLPDYEVVWKNGVAPDSDPLSFDSTDLVTEVPEATQRLWIARVKKAGFKNKRSVFESANKEGLWIIDHTREKDVTKVVNARIQGGAADLTKLALIELNNNERLKELGFRLLIPVHDEIIAECPEENLKECSKLLAETMSKAAEEVLEMPIKCDVACSYQWYGEEIDV